MSSNLARFGSPSGSSSVSPAFSHKSVDLDAPLKSTGEGDEVSFQHKPRGAVEATMNEKADGLSEQVVFLVSRGEHGWILRQRAEAIDHKDCLSVIDGEVQANASPQYNCML